MVHGTWYNTVVGARSIYLIHFIHKMQLSVQFCKLSNLLRLHTNVQFLKHSPIFKLQGDAKNSYKGIGGAVRVSEDEYVLDSFGEYMRHSNSPSCIVVGRRVIANTELHPGDELTYDSNQLPISTYKAFKKYSNV